MSLDSLGSLRSLLQAREQGASLQNDKLEQVQAAVQQTGTSEAQRMDQLGLEKLKAEYDVALQAALKERLEAQKAREEKAVVVAQLATVVSAVFSIGGNLLDLGKGNKLGEQNVDRKSDFSSGQNKTYIDASRSGKTDVLTSNSNSTGQSDVALVTTGDGKGVISSSVATLDRRDIQDGLVKGGFLQRDGEGNLSLTAKGSAAGLKLDGQGTEAITGKDELSKLAEGDFIRKGEDGKYFVTDKGAKEGLTLDGDKVVKKVGDITNKDGNVVNFDDLYALDKGVAREIFDSKKRDFTRSEAVAFKDATKGSGNSDDSGNALFTVNADNSKTINGEGQTQDDNRKKLEDQGVLTYVAQNQQQQQALASLGITAKEGESINPLNLSQDQRSKLSGLAKEGGIGEQFNVNKALEQGSIQRNIADFDDKLGDYFKATKSIGKGFGDNVFDKGGDALKKGFNLVTEAFNDVSPFIQAWLAAKDRLANTEEQLREATDKLAASLKKLKELELAIAGPHKDDAAEGGETGDE